MKEQHSKVQTKDRRRLRGTWLLLAAVILCAVIVVSAPGMQRLYHALTSAPADTLSAQAIGNIDISLTKAEEEQYMLVPGVPTAQQLTVGITAESDPCWVFVTVEEKNGADEYLNWQIADGWTQLTNGSEAVEGVFYRQRQDLSIASWNVLQDDQVVPDPQTMTKTVLQQLAQQEQSQWPRLAYRAWAISLDGVDSAYAAWNLLMQETWTVEYETAAPNANVTAALEVPGGLTLAAYDVTLLDELNNAAQPVGGVQVSLPVAEGADAAIVLHELTSHSQIVSAIEAGEAVALDAGNGTSTIVEVLDATVANGMATFTASSFSPYYVVSGHTETLKSWWQDSSGGTTDANTRFNVDRDIYGLDASDTETQIYYVEPDTTFYLYVKSGAEAVRAITENTSNGNITLSSAVNDPAGILVKVSSSAVAGQSLTFTVNDTWTVQIIVDGDVADNTFDNPDYPVYVGITFNPMTVAIANEPRVSGNDTNDWTYITDMSALTMTGSSSSYKQKDVIAPVADSKASDYLVESIMDQNFLEGTDDDSVKGLIDTEMNTNDGYPPTVELDQFVRTINWQGIAEKLLSDSNLSSKILATDGQKPSMTNYGVVGGYVLQPYVIKLQTSKYVGWHINACFVPVCDENTQWMNFDENLPEGAYIDFLNVPLRKPLTTGSNKASTSLMHSVQPGGTDYVTISESEYVTLSDGRKLRFIGWNTQPDGSGCQYPGSGGVYDSPSKDSTYWAGQTHDHDNADTQAKNPFLSGQTGTMYAFWSAIAERLELHKIVETDVPISSPATFEFKLTITSLEGVQLSQGGGDKIVFELYDAATDTLVPNSKDSNTPLAVNNSVTIRMPATQYAAIFLPTGTQYKIEETGIATNYTLVNSVNAEGTISGKGKDGNVIFTNSYNSTKGFLDLSKNVVDENEEADPEQLFSFAVTFDDEKIASNKENAVEFTLYNELDEAVYDTSDRVTITEVGSSYTVLLKHGERIVFSGLEAGTTYSITESAVDNYAATVTTQVGDEAVTHTTNPASGSIVEDKFTNVEYVNTYNPPVTNGTLTITKAFDGCTPEAGESFVFTVKNDENAEIAEVVIYGAGSKTLSVPYDTYTVTEDGSWSWKYSVNAIEPANAKVTISTSNKDDTVTFTNVLSNGKWLEDGAGVTNNFGTGSATTEGGEQ